MDVMHSSRIRFLCFFENPKNATFYVFLKRHFQKKRNPKFEVSDFADFSLHGISNTGLKQCMFTGSNIYGISTCVKDNKINLIECGI